MQSRASVYTVEDWNDAWRFGFLTWLQEVSRRSMAQQGLSVVVAPDRASLRFARTLALEADLDAPAIHFVTSTQLRSLLAAATGIDESHTLRQTLRLLLSTAAEHCDGDGAAAVAAAPDSLLKAIDLLGNAGWDLSEHASSSVKKVLAEFTRLRQACGFWMLHETDQALVEASRNSPPPIADLCIIGFDAAHWPSWTLLSAAVRLSSRAAVYLRLPTHAAADLDSLWIGTWEEEFSSSAPVAFETSRSETTPFRFLVAEDTAEEAHVIVQQALRFLADPDCTRLGIIFPGPGALARRVSAELSELDLPHYDGIGHLAPPEEQCGDWIAWLDFQENPGLPTLIRFIRALPSTEPVFGAGGAGRIIEDLKSAYRRTLLDDVEVLARFMPNWSDGLRGIPRLPPKAPLPELVRATLSACEILGWSDRAKELRRLTSAWVEQLGVDVSLRVYVQWLRELHSRPVLTRDPLGNHPYSRTQLVVSSLVGTQTFSHLIIAGLKQGKWPPSFDQSGWISDSVIDGLNARIRVLNRKARRGGRQGEGHETVVGGRSICLGPSQKRELAWRDFQSGISAAQAVAFTTSITDESAPERVANPSEFLTRTFHAAHGIPLSQAAMRDLLAHTRAWVEGGPTKAPQIPAAFPELREIYRVRRDPSLPFGKFEFAMDDSPKEVPILNATDWEQALSSPSLVWMRRFLGVQQVDDDCAEIPWAAAIGDWVHRWLKSISGDQLPGMMSPRPSGDEMLRRVQHSALRFRDQVTGAGGTPEWWSALWAQSLEIANDLARQVARVNSRYRSVATEWRLPDPTIITVNQRLRLAIRGRLDVVLAAAHDDLWIVDYKTGRSTELKPAKVTEGDGLQLALYALALQATGAKSIGLSRLTRQLTLDEPQLCIDDVSLVSLQNFWEGLASMGMRGVFGARGPLRDEFSFAAEHPLATLVIDEDILERKWELTHPILAGIWP